MVVGLSEAAQVFKTANRRIPAHHNSKMSISAPSTQRSSKDVYNGHHPPHPPHPHQFAIEGSGQLPPVNQQQRPSPYANRSVSVNTRKKPPNRFIFTPPPPRPHPFENGRPVTPSSERVGNHVLKTNPILTKITQKIAVFTEMRSLYANLCKK